MLHVNEFINFLCKIKNYKNLQNSRKHRKLLKGTMLTSSGKNRSKMSEMHEYFKRKFVIDF